MKIAINRCFGGFSLSPMAVKRIAELKGKPCFFYKGGLTSPYIKEENPTTSEWLHISAFTIGDADELNRLLSRELNRDVALFNKKYSEISLNYREDSRTDPHVIQVIEELGADASNKVSELKVIEIPDGIKYEIEEYDGVESVHEVHRSWN